MCAWGAMHSNEVGLAQIRKWESIEYSGNHPTVDEWKIMVKLMRMPISKRNVSINIYNDGFKTGNIGRVPGQRMWKWQRHTGKKLGGKKRQRRGKAKQEAKISKCGFTLIFFCPFLASFAFSFVSILNNFSVLTGT